MTDEQLNNVVHGFHAQLAQELVNAFRQADNKAEHDYLTKKIRAILHQHIQGAYSSTWSRKVK